MLVRGHLIEKWKSGIIIQKTEKYVLYVVELVDGITRKRHTDQLWKTYPKLNETEPLETEEDHESEP